MRGTVDSSVVHLHDCPHLIETVEIVTKKEKDFTEREPTLVAAETSLTTVKNHGVSRVSEGGAEIVLVIASTVHDKSDVEETAEAHMTVVERSHRKLRKKSLSQQAYIPGRRRARSRKTRRMRWHQGQYRSIIFGACAVLNLGAQQAVAFIVGSLVDATRLSQNMGM